VFWGTGHLRTSDDGFLRKIVPAEIDGCAIRCGGLSHVSNELRAEFRRHLDVVIRGLPDDGARA
jgi:hypothetical protein